MYPNIKVASAEPNKIVMRDGPVDLTVEPNRVGVQLFDRTGLKDLPATTAKIANSIFAILEVPEFTRIGLREIYWKVFPTKAEASAEVLKFGLLRLPEGKHFGVAGPPISPEIHFQREEGSKGFGVRIKAETVEFKVEFPYVWHKVAESIAEIRETLSFDIDCFVQGTILRSQISIEDWITQTLHVIRRDTDAFLGG